MNYIFLKKIKENLSKTLLAQVDKIPNDAKDINISGNYDGLIDITYTSESQEKEQNNSQDQENK